MTKERRTFEIRAETGGKPRLVGYAAVFNSLSDDLGGFREQISPGAFAETIKKDDIRALFDHDSRYVLGRNTSGSLKLSEDDKGLLVEIDPPDAAWASDLMRSVERGDIDQMSFGFRTKSDSWDNVLGKNGPPIRTLHEVDLFDVSIVTYPAYPDTSVALRSLKGRVAPWQAAWRARFLNLLSKENWEK